jgi:hypothetical protein
MALVQVSARLSSDKLKQAKKALGAKTTSEAIQKALDFVTEKAAHDLVIQRYSGVGKQGSFEVN